MDKSSSFLYPQMVQIRLQTLSLFAGRKDLISIELRYLHHYDLDCPIFETK